MVRSVSVVASTVVVTIGTMISGVFPLKGGKSTCILCHSLMGHAQDDSGARCGLLRFWHSVGSYELCLLCPCIFYIFV